MDNSRNVHSAIIEGFSPAMNRYSTAISNQDARWMIWIEAAELLAGQDLHRDDAQMDAALTAYLGGVTAGEFALNMIEYPSRQSQAMLRITLCALYGGVILLGLLWCFGGGR